jgi:hypothetical protein
MVQMELSGIDHLVYLCRIYKFSLDAHTRKNQLTLSELHPIQRLSEEPAR